MNIALEAVSIEQKSVLRNLLELYIYDFTEFIPDDVDCHGLYGYKYLDQYWTEEGRHPFFIYIDGNIAGFVLVRRYYVSDLNDYIYSIAEFFVMKKYRKQGVGREVAFRIFNMFSGVWEVAEVEENRPAQAFWRKVIHAFTQGDFEEIQKEDWIGPVQRFL
ncbi:GNAT family N-acetyltransferase [Desulfitobacterium metallireducens]|uniref:Acetyltransferase n=1 Tax=Desulfitobacterium metallireducens DSM 15288 TaxID=871968 RepID=W0E9F1_9FIRM|nr:GNAT family N-acetyltransferase [Desulfitobacterium metallireducens]AHF07392.1 acetyltransferase [Desulfitobacterium metallireducens DSM 15288]